MKFNETIIRILVKQHAQIFNTTRKPHKKHLKLVEAPAFLKNLLARLPRRCLGFTWTPESLPLGFVIMIAFI